MKVKLEQFLALDAETTSTMRLLTAVVNSMDKTQIPTVAESRDKLKEALAENYIRRHNYSSLPRNRVQKNILLDSFVVRFLIINVVVNALETGIKPESANAPADELYSAIENRKTDYKEIEKIARQDAESGRYRSLLDILIDLSGRYLLNQSDHINYFMTRQYYKLNNTEHSVLVNDVIDYLADMGITPKTPDHIYKQVPLLNANGETKGDLDLVVLSDSGQWHIIEAKTGKRKNITSMKARAKRSLRHNYDFLKRELGIDPKLTGVYRVNGSDIFNWFRYERSGAE